MFGLIEKVAKTAVGVAVLPVTAAIDLVSLPAIANELRDASTPKVLRTVIQNVEEIATGDWEK